MTALDLRAAAVAVVLTAACDSDFEPSSRVSGYRVLAARADQPFARPGEVVRIDALAVDRDRRPFQLAWGTCERPASTTALGCVQELSSGGALELGDGRHDVRIPDDILAGVPPAGAPAVTVGAVLVLCPGTVAPGPGPGDLPLRCVDQAGDELALGEFDVAVKRIFVRTADRNANPVIERVLLDGAPWPEDEVRAMAPCDDPDQTSFDRCQGPAHSLSVELAPESFERGVDQTGTPYRETLIVQFYATRGLFEYEVKDATTPVTRYRAQEGDGEVTLWIVTRDDRGGVAWTSRRAAVDRR